MRGASVKDPRRLIVFARYPIPGETKTRLMPALGPHGAAELQQRMTEHAMARAREFMTASSIPVVVYYEGGTPRLMRQWLGRGVSYRRQASDDLGSRMARTFVEVFTSGASRAVMVGTDCPGLTPAHLGEAFDALERSDLVLGPASDGGYYLIGLKRMAGQLFGGVPWGTGAVLDRTLRIASDLGLSTKLVGTLDDVDRPEDLAVWEREAERARSHISSMRISVIIPALNEAATIAATLRSVQGASGVEVVVADGGSSDETVEIARRFDVKLCSCQAGKAQQMNAGAAEATGDVLLFLHADTRLPDEFAQSVREALSRPGIAGGAFELRIDSPRRGLRLIERVVNWRSKALQMPYGDQALFLSAALFRAMGGFPEIPIMEDFEFMRRLRKHGEIVIIPAPVCTSARRWLALGPLRTTLMNQVVIAAYYAGFSLRWLARWYDRECVSAQPGTSR
ncbi:MAG: DUF2064 domain-containing protein [Candidatus Abyssobacteria bacterium SURF_17]|uniref:DUF2064 domain-containing protein n=1 Tax=Candidatus Abyssobacteria bacterium SURF_17 TaxID=2093361 RepID=A0A419F8X6_9BACT|nr:MAG: DUF2064 domain-containing protein [Candidatus Abyssubacteria bacterium SURF_17]